MTTRCLRGGKLTLLPRSPREARPVFCDDPKMTDVSEGFAKTGCRVIRAIQACEDAANRNLYRSACCYPGGDGRHTVFSCPAVSVTSCHGYGVDDGASVVRDLPKSGHDFGATRSRALEPLIASSIYGLALSRAPCSLQLDHTVASDSGVLRVRGGRAGPSPVCEPDRCCCVWPWGRRVPARVCLYIRS